MVLLDELLIESDEVLCIDIRHEFPTKIQSLVNGSVFIPVLPQELVLEDLARGEGVGDR